MTDTQTKRVPRIKKSDKEYQRKIARERIEILFSLAEKEAKTHPERSRRYAQLIWELSKKYKVRLGKKKYRFCRRCFTWWTPETLKVRLVRRPYSMVVYKCLVCGAEYRFPLIREKKGEQESS